MTSKIFAVLVFVAVLYISKTVCKFLDKSYQNYIFQLKEKIFCRKYLVRKPVVSAFYKAIVPTSYRIDIWTCVPHNSNEGPNVVTEVSKSRTVCSKIIPYSTFSFALENQMPGPWRWMLPEGLLQPQGRNKSSQKLRSRSNVLSFTVNTLYCVIKRVK